MKQNKIIAPIITLLFVIVLVILGSSLLSFLNFDSVQTSIVNGSLETSIVLIKNIFSKEGISYFFSNIITNFSLIEPLLLIVISFFAVGIFKNSGLLNHLCSPLKKLKFSFLTFLVVLLSVISTIVGDYSYIILLPLVVVIYEYLGKSKTLGLVTVFLGITIGYGTGIFYNYTDHILGTLTQISAVANVDASYRFDLYSNLYIMIATTFILSYLITIFVNKYLSKKFVVEETEELEVVKSSKALSVSLISFLFIFGLVIAMLIPKFGGILLDNSATVFVAKIFNDSSPFNQSFIFLYFVILSLSSIVYGFISKNIKSSIDIYKGFSSQCKDIGYLLLLVFLYSILVGVVNYTNIGVFFVNKLISLISVLDFSGIPLIIITFVFVILMSIFIPGSLEKWVLISPLLIPLFMRANISPDFTQFVFKAADSIGKVISPLFIYYIITVGIAQKYKHISLFKIMKVSIPIIIIMTIVWLLIIIIWYVSGLPLGNGITAAM